MDPTDFTNSAFVTPQQTEQLRQYVTALQNAGLKPDATSWSGVLAHALMGGAGALGMNQANQQQRQMLQQGQQGLQNTTDPTVRALLGQGFNPQVPQQGAPASASGQPAQQPMSGAPRGIRNNNPGNIEDGPFAKSMPGYAGTDGRFAIFQNPQAGQQAMDRLLTSYGNRGINTPQAIAARWAPSGDGRQ